MKRLIVDVPNLFYRVTSATTGKYGADAEDKANLALHSCLNTMLKWYNGIKPDQIIVVFEGGNNWRKTYTASPKCISKVGYKANRERSPEMEHLFQVISDFERLAREHTAIVCLSASTLEGDDLVAGCAKRFSNEGDQVIILSGDKDFMQLLKYPGVKLLNPDKGVYRECEDPEYFMFEKCIRGDGGDNVRSAFPRVRSTRLEKAYKDQFEMVSLMNEVWTVKDVKTNEVIEQYRVGDLFEENKILMDLDCQPNEIKELINKTIDDGLASHGKFSLFAFSKFCGQHGLKQIGDNSTKYVNLFNCKIVEENNTNKRGILRFN